MNRREFLKRSMMASATLAAEATQTTALADHASFDVVLLGGRVMDPETRFDAIRNIGIRDGVIRAITTKHLQGTLTIDAGGLVVAPGFIDVLAHGMNLENNRYQAYDGVTTVLALEGETIDVDGWYAQRAGKMILNYGASVGHGEARAKVVGRQKREMDALRKMTLMPARRLEKRADDEKQGPYSHRSGC